MKKEGRKDIHKHIIFLSSHYQQGLLSLPTTATNKKNITLQFHNMY